MRKLNPLNFSYIEGSRVYLEPVDYYFILQYNNKSARSNGEKVIGIEFYKNKRKLPWIKVASKFNADNGVFDHVGPGFTCLNRLIM